MAQTPALAGDVTTSEHSLQRPVRHRVDIGVNCGAVPAMLDCVGDNVEWATGTKINSSQHGLSDSPAERDQGQHQVSYRNEDNNK